MFSRIFKFIRNPLFLIFLVFTNCGEKYTSFLELDSNQDGKIDNYMISLKDGSLGILIATDEDKDGKFEDLSWVVGEPGKEKESQVVFNQISKNGAAKSKTWYGPGNIKLVEFSDEDGDGFLETKAYFNKEAKPKVVSGHIARIEIDTDKDGKTDAWLFPADRIEIDSNKDGIPDRVSVNPDKIREAFQHLHAKKKFELETMSLGKENSFVLHPELIKEERWKSIISISF